METYTKQDLEVSNKVATGEIKIKIINLLEKEKWERHELSVNFLEKYNPTEELENAINELCLLSHNNGVEDIINIITKLS